jgi:NADP-dependent 3-hydroxy acid dehydrogenase YdfG
MALDSLIKNTSIALVLFLSGCTLVEPECHPKLYDANIKGVLNQTTSVTDAFLTQTSGFECTARY